MDSLLIFSILQKIKIKIMTTQEVANRLVELCRMGQIDAAQQELYADDVTSTEPENAPMREAKGKQAIEEKSKMFQSMIEEFHGATISDPIVTGNHFAITWDLDITMKDRGRSKMQEVCVYQVKDGKVASEQFFY
jgi:hypothetical protein